MSNNRKIDLDPTKTVRDPHHGGLSEWCYHGNSFYIRTQSQTRWSRVRRIKLTPKRVIELHKLL